MGEAAPFSEDIVIERARQLSQAPYAPPQDTIPAAYKDINYDQYRAIRFKKDLALWKHDNVSFTAEFFSAGYIYLAPVQIFVVDEGKAAELKYRVQPLHIRSRSDPAARKRKPRLFRFPLAHAH